VLGLYNPERLGPLAVWFDFLKQSSPQIEGDILEAGVWRGRSLLTSAIILSSIAPEKRILGFDSFGGFPGHLDDRDEPRTFELLFANGLISREHFERVQKNLQHLEFLKGESITSRNISSSGDFSQTSVTLIRNKAQYLGLQNIELVEGNYDQTMQGRFQGKLCAVLLDCDLYTSYDNVLEYTWESLTQGGMLYLDEFYSLKFPGARLAVQNFFKERDAHFFNRVDEFNGFERWWVIKP
jgi:hypothetical protein